jgi:aldehyde oxidoreductase
MIKFMLNNKEKIYEGDEKISILKYLRNIEGITSVKDGCSGQGACGACLVELNGKPTLSCVTPMSKVNQSKVITIEGFPKGLKELLGKAFVEKGAVQCGFCTPGFLMRTKVLLEENINPTDEEIIKALHMNLCRCTGYIKIFEAIKLAARALRDQKKIQLTKSAKVGARHPKYDAYEKALGQSPFVDDIKIEHMLHTALKFSDFPRAKVISIDSTEAEKVKGVKRVVLGGEIPGERMNGLIVKDWPVMVIPGEITRYIGDVLAGVVADTEEIARKAVDKIKVLYEVLEPLTNMLESEHSSIKIHETGNLLDTCTIKRGIEADQAMEQSDYVA